MVKAQAPIKPIGLDLSHATAAEKCRHNRHFQIYELNNFGGVCTDDITTYVH